MSLPIGVTIVIQITLQRRLLKREAEKNGVLITYMIWLVMLVNGHICSIFTFIM